MNMENAKNRPEANKESEPLKPQILDPKTVGGVAPTADQAIDMGLSVKWAPWNVGASKPEDYGAYFAWGEINASKEIYNWNSSYLFFVYDEVNEKLFYSKYNGSVKNEILESADDAATANWGCEWRMPTLAELHELMNKDNCTWTWVENYNDSGINGYEVKSKKTDGLLFLPAAGYCGDSGLDDAGYYGYYWSSELHSGDAYNACHLYFHSIDRFSSYFSRGYGFSVRAVAVSAE